MKALACSDLHIGAGGAMLPPGQRLRDQEQVLDRIAEIADEHRVDAVLVAGDVFHRPRPTPEELHVARRFFRSFTVPVLACVGNAAHDLEADGRPSAVELFHGGHVTVHRQPGLWLDGVVATLPSVPLGRLLAAQPGLGREQAAMLAAELLVTEAARLRSQGARVLVAHWSVSGAVTATGMGVGPDFGTVLPVEELAGQGWHAIVLGHIHRAQHYVGVTGWLDTSAGTRTCDAFYCSSPLPLDFGEATAPHGVTILDTAEDTCEFVPIASRPLVTLDLDGTALAEAGAYDFIAARTDAIVRVRYTATEEQHRRIDQHAIRRALLNGGAAAVRIEPTVIRGTRQRNATVDTTLAPLDAITEWAAAQQLNGKTEPLRHLTRTYLQETRA